MSKEEYINFFTKLIEDYKQIIDDERAQIINKNFESSKYTKYNAILLCVMLLENVISSFNFNNTESKYLWNIIIFEETIFLVFNIVKQEEISMKTEKISDSVKRNELEIKKIKNVLEFLKDTSEEEINKYLSYKMN